MKNMEHVINDAAMLSQILFNAQPSIYNTTIEIRKREQIIQLYCKLKMNFVKYIPIMS
jgi:hypothetical protein